MGSAYVKFENQASHYALVGVAAYFSFAQDGRIEAARVGISGMSPKAYRATAAEAALTGHMPTASVFAEGGEPCGRRGRGERRLACLERLPRCHGASLYAAGAGDRAYPRRSSLNGTGGRHAG